MSTWKIAAVATVLAAGACASGPETTEEEEALQQRAEATLQTMTQRDPGLKPLIDRSHGYAVFPSVGRGGVLVGGATGVGVVYEQGEPVGTVELNQASLGAQLGGQTFAQLILFEDAAAFRKLTFGEWSLGGNVSAVALSAGAAGSAVFRDGVAVFVMPRGGLMVDFSVAGQRLRYRPVIE